MSPTVLPCPHCESTQTMCMATEKSHNYWRCFECRQAFDVPNKPEKTIDRLRRDALKPKLVFPMGHR